MEIINRIRQILSDPIHRFQLKVLIGLSVVWFCIYMVTGSENSGASSITSEIVSPSPPVFSLRETASAQFYRESNVTDKQFISLKDQEKLDATLDEAAKNRPGSPGIMFNFDVPTFDRVKQSYFEHASTRGWDCQQTFVTWELICLCNAKPKADGTSAERFMYAYNDPTIRSTFIKEELQRFDERLDYEVKRQIGLTKVMRAYFWYTDKNLFLTTFVPSLKPLWTCTVDTPSAFGCAIECTPSTEVVAAVEQTGD